MEGMETEKENTAATTSAVSISAETDKASPMPDATQKKKLLIYAHYYAPDVASTGQILQELAEGIKDTFDVTVICAVPSYTGTVDPAYREKPFYFEELNGVKIIRVRVPAFTKRDKLSRVKNILSYYRGARKATALAGAQDYVGGTCSVNVSGGSDLNYVLGGGRADVAACRSPSDGRSEHCSPSAPRHKRRVPRPVPCPTQGRAAGRPRRSDSRARR